MQCSLQVQVLIFLPALPLQALKIPIHCSVVAEITGPKIPSSEWKQVPALNDNLKYPHGKSVTFLNICEAAQEKVPWKQMVFVLPFQNPFLSHGVWRDMRWDWLLSGSVPSLQFEGKSQRSESNSWAQIPIGVGLTLLLWFINSPHSRPHTESRTAASQPE